VSDKFYHFRTSDAVRVCGVNQNFFPIVLVRRGNLDAPDNWLFYDHQVRKTGIDKLTALKAALPGRNITWISGFPIGIDINIPRLQQLLSKQGDISQYHKKANDLIQNQINARIGFDLYRIGGENPFIKFEYQNQGGSVRTNTATFPAPLGFPDNQSGIQSAELVFPIWEIQHLDEPFSTHTLLHEMVAHLAGVPGHMDGLNYPEPEMYHLFVINSHPRASNGEIPTTTSFF